MNTERITAGQRSDPGDLTAEPLAKLMAGLKQVKRQRRTAPANQRQAPATAGVDTAQTAHRMKTAPQMQQMITDVLDAHGIAVSDPAAFLWLALPSRRSDW